MKRKKWIYLFVSIFLVLLIGLSAAYKWPAYQEYVRKKQEKQLLEEALHNLETMKDAVELYFQPNSSAHQSDILLHEILKLANKNLINGKWDKLGVYTSENFIYLGGCYSNWCYAEANRKDASYNLYFQYNGKKWIYKRCSTEMTELGRTICTHLKAKGWEYVDGEK